MSIYSLALFETVILLSTVICLQPRKYNAMQCTFRYSEQSQLKISIQVDGFWKKGWRCNTSIFYLLIYFLTTCTEIELFLETAELPVSL